MCCDIFEARKMHLSGSNDILKLQRENVPGYMMPWHAIESSYAIEVVLHSRKKGLWVVGFIRMQIHGENNLHARS